MMRGRLAASDSGLDLMDIVARFGQSALRGQLSARFDAPRPRITGDLRVSALDAALLSATGSSHAADGSSPRHQTAGSPAGRSADVPGWLEAVDINAAITVQEFIHTPVAIRNASLRLSVRDGRLSAPLDATIAEVPFHGDLAVNRQGDGPVLKLGLTATDANAAKLAESLTGIEGIRGRFNQIEFHAATSDARTVDFLNGFDIGLNLTGAQLSYGNVAGGKPVDLTLDDLALTIPGGKEMSVSAQGTLLNDPFNYRIHRGRPGSAPQARRLACRLVRHRGRRRVWHQRLAGKRARIIHKPG